MTREHWRAFIALAVGVLLSGAAVVLAYASRPSSGSAYLRLSFDSKSEDRGIVAALAAAGFHDVVSESTEWVLLDDFGVGERVPLDRYAERVGDIDLRNDGYAAKLRSLFLTDSARVVFVRRPILSLLPGAAAALERTLRAALPGRPFTLDTPPRGAFSAFNLAAALLGLLLVAFLTRSAVKTFLSLPATVALGVFGPGGLAAAGFLYAAHRSFISCCREISTALSLFSSKKGEDRATVDMVKFCAAWGVESIPIFLLFAAAAAAAALLTGVPGGVFVVSAAASLCSGYAYLALSKTLSERRGHGRFVPVRLRPAFAPSFLGQARSLLPFSAIAVALFLVGFSGRLPAAPTASAFSPGASPGASPGITEQDYRAHLEAQRSFRTTNLYAPRAGEAYTDYRLDESGLAAATDNVAVDPEPLRTDLPPAEGMLFSSPGGNGRPGGAWIAELIAVLISLAVSIPSTLSTRLLVRRGKESADSAEKRIAA